MSAHFPDQFPAVGGIACDKLASKKLFLLPLAEDDIFQLPALRFIATHQPARPHEFRGQQTETEKNRQHSRSRRNQQYDSSQKQSKSCYHKEHPADLLDRAEDLQPLLG